MGNRLKDRTRERNLEKREFTRDLTNLVSLTPFGARFTPNVKLYFIPKGESLEGY
jgi:hypothetical protein